MAHPNWLLSKNNSTHIEWRTFLNPWITVEARKLLKGTKINVSKGIMPVDLIKVIGFDVCGGKWAVYGALNHRPIPNALDITFVRTKREAEKKVALLKKNYDIFGTDGMNW